MIKKAHYSSLILTDQMTREDALKKISVAPYTEEIEDDLSMLQISLKFPLWN